MKPRWWTCGCGHRNCSRETGTPVCAGCSKPAGFSVAAPKNQGGFDFGKNDKRSVEQTKEESQ
jgi:hypothetical protein